VVENSTHNPNIKGSNPTPSAGKKKKLKRVFKIDCGIVAQWLNTRLINPRSRVRILPIGLRKGIFKELIVPL
jgi:hypothetical protein